MPIFSQDQLKKVVKDTLTANVPEGHTNAIVGMVDNNGVQVIASFKLKDKWTLTGAAKHDWDGDNTVGTSVVYSW